jgi:hypothetical protein
MRSQKRERGSGKGKGASGRAAEAWKVCSVAVSSRSCELG